MTGRARRGQVMITHLDEAVYWAAQLDEQLTEANVAPHTDGCFTVPGDPCVLCQLRVELESARDEQVEQQEAN